MAEIITGVLLVVVGAVSFYFVLRNKKNGVQEAVDTAVDKVEDKIEELKDKKDAG